MLCQELKIPTEFGLQRPLFAEKLVGLCNKKHGHESLDSRSFFSEGAKLLLCRNITSCGIVSFSERNFSTYLGRVGCNLLMIDE